MLFCRICLDYNSTRSSSIRFSPMAVQWRSGDMVQRTKLAGWHQSCTHSDWENHCAATSGNSQCSMEWPAVDEVTHLIWGGRQSHLCKRCPGIQKAVGLSTRPADRVSEDSWLILHLLRLEAEASCLQPCAIGHIMQRIFNHHWTVAQWTLWTTVPSVAWSSVQTRRRTLSEFYRLWRRITLAHTTFNECVRTHLCKLSLSCNSYLVILLLLLINLVDFVYNYGTLIIIFPSGLK